MIAEIPSSWPNRFAYLSYLPGGRSCYSLFLSIFSPLFAGLCQDIHYRPSLHLSPPLRGFPSSALPPESGSGSQVELPREESTLSLATQSNATPTSPVGSVLSSASHVIITGGSFVAAQTNMKGSDTSINEWFLFYGEVAPNAILNAGGRAHPVGCYPGTREAVMDDIDKWVRTDGDCKVMWLSGPAGSGKSSIVQSYAERCIQRTIPSANFFFFRPDSTRNHPRSLAATLLYQIIDSYPQAKGSIEAIIAEKPLILKGSLHDQFKNLILLPMRDIHRRSSHSEPPIVLLIDGLDECSSNAKHEQQAIIEILNNLVSQHDSPFIALVASRPEPHLTMSFNSISSYVKTVFLDERYGASADIRHYVTKEFAKVKRNHHLAHTLDADWPSPARINEVVEKSSGQFLYADIAIRFISSSPASPDLSLETVLGIRPVKKDSPFSELDAMYTYILSQVDDWKTVHEILGAQIILTTCDDILVNEAHIAKLTIDYYLTALGFDMREVLSDISGLAAILRYDNGTKRILFYHASFPDFLRNRQRSGRYFVDVDAISAILVPALLRSTYNDFSLRIFIYTFTGPWLQNSIPRSLSQLLFRYPSPRPSMYDTFYTCDLARLFDRFRHLYYRDEFPLYTQLLRRWFGWFLQIRKPRRDQISMLPCALLILDELDPPQGIGKPTTSELPPVVSLSPRTKVATDSRSPSHSVIILPGLNLQDWQQAEESCWKEEVSDGLRMLKESCADHDDIAPGFKLSDSKLHMRARSLRWQIETIIEWRRNGGEPLILRPIPGYVVNQDFKLPFV